MLWRETDGESGRPIEISSDRMGLKEDDRRTISWQGREGKRNG